MKTMFFVIILGSILMAQNTSKFVIDKNSGEKMLIGKIQRNDFMDSTFSWWFNSEYNFYDIDSTYLEILNTDLRNYSITLVLGTWCSDSRTQVPRFFKILDAINYPVEKLLIIAVNRDIKAQDLDIDNLKIKLVPTFIIYKDNTELGRIIESPTESLEKDLIKIINSKK